MGPGERLKAARKRFQATSKKSTEEVAQELFPMLTPEASREKLRRIESNADIRPHAEAQRILQTYGVPLAGQAQALAFYQLGQRLTELVSRSGYTKAFLAKKAGFSYHHFARILSGTRPVASPKKLMRIADLLGASASERNDLVRIADFPDYDPLLMEVSKGENENSRLVDELREKLSSDEEVDAQTEHYGILKTRRDYAIGPSGITDLAIRAVAETVEALERQELDASEEASEQVVRISLGRHFVGDHRLLQAFLASVCKALSKGIEVRCLIPVPADPRDAFNAISNSLTFLSVTGGKYDLRLDERQAGDSHDASRSIILPSGSVVQFLPKEETERRDSALRIEDPHRLFERHFDRRFKSGRRPLRLFQSSKDGPGRFQKALAEAEAEPGPRLIVRRRPPTAMLLPELWDDEKKQIDPRYSNEIGGGRSASPWRFERLAMIKLRESGSDEQCDRYLESLREEKLQRLDRMFEALRKDVVREVYPRDVLEEFFASPVTPKKIRLALIDQFVEWLDDFENYKVALAPTGRLTSTAFFGVHGGDHVFLSVWRQSSDADYLHVEEPLIAQAFKDYFVSQWEALGAENTDKSKVKDWFLKQRKKV